MVKTQCKNIFCASIPLFCIIPTSVPEPEKCFMPTRKKSEIFAAIRNSFRSLYPAKSALLYSKIQRLAALDSRLTSLAFARIPRGP
jgi:hypothetical protein